MRKFRPEIVIVRRLRDGPRKSRVRIGLRVALFFLVAVLATGAVAIVLNLRLEDSLTAAIPRH